MVSLAENSNKYIAYNQKLFQCPSARVKYAVVNSTESNYDDPFSIE